MISEALPAWPDADAVAPREGVTITAEQLRRLGDGNEREGFRYLRSMIAAETERKTAAGSTSWPRTVRLAQPEDEQKIVDTLMVDVMENAAHIAPPSPARILTHVQAGTRQKGGWVGVIDAPDGSIAAVVVLNLFQWWWSEHYYIGEVVMFVRPEYRRSRYADDLLDFQKWFAERMTAECKRPVYLFCGVLGTRRLRSKLLLYWRRFTEVGRGYLYPPPPDAGVR